MNADLYNEYYYNSPNLIEINPKVATFGLFMDSSRNIFSK
jgi:hypothetical protein